MANVIKCPACGENNLSDQEFCQYCQTRLQPLTGDLKGADAPLTAGQIPTKKNTSDLEPILPLWLREARNSARESSGDNPTKATEPPQAPPRPASSGGDDLLAGLRSQAQDRDEEDTPDWLTNITGETPKTKKPQTESPDVRWVELGAANDFAQSEPESDIPAWLKGISPTASQSGEKDELTDWFRNESDSQEPQQPSQPISLDSPPAAETQDWLHSMVADDGAFNDSENAVDEPFISSDTPDWLRAMAAENDAQNVNAPLSNSGMPPASSDTPDWLRAMAAENEAQNVNMPPINADTPPVSSDTPDWLHAMTEQEKPQSADSAGFSETGLGESDAARPSAGDTADWLKGFESSTSSSDQDWLKEIQSGESEQPSWLSAAPAFMPEQEQPSIAPDKDDDLDTPGWLKSAAPTSVPEQEQSPIAPEKDVDALDIPSWLKAAAPQSSIFDEPSTAQETTAPASSSSDTSDWLNAFKSVDMPDAETIPAFSTEAPVDSAPPAFVDNAQPGANEDALFTDMPAWLSMADDSVAPESIPAPITNADAISPGDLPSWVQAMRPVDAGTPQPSSASLSSDRKLESSGALAGLQGVLPAVKGFSPTSKPKAYTIRIKASEEQQAHAALLAQVLAAETEPVPIGSFSTLGTSRGLRWLLVLLLFTVLTAALLTQTPIFSLPVGWPAEVDSALNVVEAIPDGAPVLVAFDYEPARAAEMEAAAVPVFDLMNNPRFTFISTNEMGPILAERFISEYFADNYQSGVQYLNLGYLPGGQMGIRAFAENPSVTAPYAYAQSSTLLNFTPTSAWDLPPLQDVKSLSQFAMLIVITDNADSARVWIEQTTSARGAIPFVVISSAQAAPMIQPYYASHQVSGLVDGLYGGALFEQVNDARPGAAGTYWDAYNIGMLLAMVLILGGGLLNLVLGLRDRAAAREAK